jgi:hypothetical protein
MVITRLMADATVLRTFATIPIADRTASTAKV